MVGAVGRRAARRRGRRGAVAGESIGRDQLTSQEDPDGASQLRPWHTRDEAGASLSVLSEQVGPGSWYLPLDLIPVGQAPTQFGATQVVL